VEMIVVRLICNVVCNVVCNVCLFVCLFVYGWLIFSPLLLKPQMCHYCSIHDDSVYGALVVDDWHI